MTPHPLSSPPRRRSADDRPGERRPTTKAKRDPEQFVLGAAGIVIVALTVGAFWLSYAHLADVAGQHGLGGSLYRRWAWPASLDAFIIAGELLMLRAGLRRATDPWALGVTAIGSAGSIALNVAGVGGTGNAGTVPVLDYVVAAVPPAAAMVAFGVLMRQIHQLVDRPTGRLEAPSEQVLEPAVTTSVQPVAAPATPGTLANPSAAVSARLPESPSEVAESKSRGGRPPGAPVEQLVEIGRAAAAEQGKLTRAIVRKAVETKGLTIGSERLTEVTGILRAEHQAPAESGPARG
ncbi:DUF2637 domain-containing protein [Streptomyces sp. NPDC058280]|uniref:DUF2637 domain-containing protein n=1 Tax=Streptomyces sp. NPDC058280 TaxID=3346419 RepID=UPI0036E65754